MLIIILLRKLSPATRISMIYLAIGVLWIMSSDSVLDLLTGGSQQTYSLIQTLKGWLFVGTTATLLYLLLKREFDARARSEQVARESESVFQELFQNVPLPMYIFDRETLVFVDVNKAMCAHYGYSRDEFLAMRITDIRPPDEVPRLIKFISQLGENTRPAGEWVHRLRDGQLIDVYVIDAPFDFNSQRAVLVIAQDITERKQAEAERLENERLRLTLEQKNELQTMRNRFISMVSHEFRRPVTTISTSIELLEHYGSRMTDDSAQKHFSRIHDQLHEMTDLLDDFLTLMRTEAAENEFKPTPVDLTALCARMIDELKQGDENRHRIDYTTSGAQIMVDGDEKRLRHAVGNLLTNAVKYSPEGGDVWLDLKVSEQNIEIHVTDHGIGIPPDDQAHIFDPFFRATNVGDLNGTGLGLSIARQSVEVHGGTLRIARSDSRGTEFIISLPINGAMSERF